eukprot:TRINITY_DN32292_c0_g1_i1.p1 TRINITY_DN32292_c0_g1~~TRINITY_DN32292_c0_g1_i1.p1  ORF type:complete len:224 (+),score=70.50 TRINITY_DN32292_c0_g1_i1:57-674(+)
MPETNAVTFLTNHGNEASLSFDASTGKRSYTLNGAKRAAPRGLQFSPRSRRLDFPGTANWHVTLPKADAKRVVPQLRSWAEASGVPYEIPDPASPVGKAAKTAIAAEPPAAPAPVNAPQINEVIFTSFTGNSVRIAQAANGGLECTVNGKHRPPPTALAYSARDRKLHFVGTKSWPVVLPKDGTAAIVAELHRTAAGAGVHLSEN